MEFRDGFLSEEHQERVKMATESMDPVAVSPLKVTSSPKASSKCNSSKFAAGKGNSVKHDKHSHSGRDGRPKKGGSGGKGTWGGLLDRDDGYDVDPNDPNYDSSEESSRKIFFEEYKKKAIVIVEEYFATDDVDFAVNEMRYLANPGNHFYFVKKLVSMAMDRHDKEKEMAAVLLSALYADVIEPPDVYKGFVTLVESADDLSVDIPDTIDVLALFIARAVVDDILPPAFLTKQIAVLPEGAKGIEVIKRAEKVYLSAHLHAEIIERKWGGSKNRSVEDVKVKINDFLIEYLTSGDMIEACRCIKELKLPFFHHEVVKLALSIAMEKRVAEGPILDLLKEAAEEGVINSSQMTKGFERLIDMIDDLSLDIIGARDLLQSLISKAASEGWLCASQLKPFSPRPKKAVEDDATKIFKAQITSSIKEYFLTGDILEMVSSLESENNSNSPELTAIFIKKLITLAMDRKNREKEMASVLLTSLSFPPEDVVNGFLLLIESAEDTALDIPVIVEDLAMFLARAVVDEVLAPQHLEEIGSQCVDPNTVGSKVHKMAQSLLQARLAGERILRCWGGGGSSRPGWALEDVKDKITKLLEEYDSGGDVREAFRCIKELSMAFFHHEVVKKALVMVMENKNERLWGLLSECFSVGLITTSQMTKGFGRVAESMDDLVLDVPDVEAQFDHYVERAKAKGWLDPSFSATPGCAENGVCS
ncbi:MA3 DOMAIN-CONTAINING TRANSLATION REGULATORY FACTOR 2 [Aristolochia californica]|uniref:MA3 DOMAIN-CONTAINING TRANSLATION REGULATORY FACTOR 2 n=1 Tax=Aristolochia californica TaxID=171875 RepID=UPI0035DC0158